MIAEISGITVNDSSVTIPQPGEEPLTFSRNDNVVFYFRCKNGAVELPNVHFSYILTRPARTDGASPDTTSQLGIDGNTQKIMFEREGDHSIKAEAQYQGTTAIGTILRFTVNDARAAALKAQSRTQAQQPITKQPEQTSTMLYIIIAAGILLTVGGLGFVFTRFRNNKTAMPISPTAADNLEEQASSLISAVTPPPAPKYDDAYVKKLEERVAELTEEVRSLRDQINALRTRAEDLGKQNKDLESQVQRLSNVKLELEELQKQKDELFAIIIHDMKNPASLIKNLVELLRGYDLNSQETQEVMADIVETTTKIVSLSQEFSKIMAMENAHLQIEPQKNDVGIIVESVCRRNSAAAEKKNIKIFADIPDNVTLAEFDSQKIEEVLDNLVSNAIKFSMSGSYVNVRIVPAKNNFTIEIEDKGLGLSEEDVKKAFQRGMRLSARPTAGEPSSGLGLWIVKRLVEAHNGSVWVKSTLGKGSTFGVILPYEQPAV